MLLFLPTFVRGHAPVPPEGWHADGEPFRLYRSLDEAVRAAVAPDGRTGRVLVLDPDALSVFDLQPARRQPTVGRIPRRAVLNLDPDGDLWRPRAVAAAGGVVVREGSEGLEPLLIFRRGAWDLPKGKLDAGETVRAAAVREVAEEVGIAEDTLTITEELGPTVHGYFWPKRDRYAVKTTHWFTMQTTATAFEPEEREGIEAVAWVPWREARTRLGYPTLRHVLDRVTDMNERRGTRG